MAHNVDYLCETNISQHLISSKVSQSQFWVPIGKMSLTAALAVLPSVLVMVAFLPGNQVTLNITRPP
ncbi:hypothetical protein C9413_31085 [Rhizobium sp. SEMIA 4085]|uniref:hypothetical protein n=1 Tax=Rhizobium gallicum TaxID=56730 RepID=UPI0014782007|nr:hypothetical protein [Rhizobium gallicum]NNH33662.1 hypothetical protein [Rhizobium sp. SEMIA 4085]